MIDQQSACESVSLRPISHTMMFSMTGTLDKRLKNSHELMNEIFLNYSILFSEAFELF